MQFKTSILFAIVNIIVAQAGLPDDLSAIGNHFTEFAPGGSHFTEWAPEDGNNWNTDDGDDWTSTVYSTVYGTTTLGVVPTAASSSFSAVPTTLTTKTTSRTTSKSSSESATSTSSSSETTYTGRGTYYEPSDDACGTSSTADDYICAIAESLYSSKGTNDEWISDACGKSITATYKGNSVTVKVVDACESCTDNDLDFSPAAFKKLADLDVGELQIEWHWD